VTLEEIFGRAGFHPITPVGDRIAEYCRKGRIMGEHGIGWVVEQMMRFLKVRRAGWNGKGQYLMLQVPNPMGKMSLPYVYITTVEGKLVPWVCSQTDLLATDWELAE
jgi:hypothetical protein